MAENLRGRKSVASVASWTNGCGAEMLRLSRKNERLFGVVGAVVEAFAKLFAGAEKRHALFTNRYGFSGARIAPLPRRPRFDREGAEAAQLHPVTARQSACDFLQNRGYDALNVAMIKMGIALREPHHQFRFDHLSCPRTAGQERYTAAALTCQTCAGTSTGNRA